MKQELSIFDHIRASDVELGHIESVEFLLDCDSDANALNNSEQYLLPLNNITSVDPTLVSLIQIPGNQTSKS